MEANPNGMDNGNSNDHHPEPALINLQYFIAELCKISCIPTTGINIFSQNVGEKILKALRDSQNESIRFEGLMKSLCEIVGAGVSPEGEDICSQSFVESILDYVRQDLVLVEGLRNSLSERRPFRSGTQGIGNLETEPPLANQSTGHRFSSELLETAPNENNELHEVNSAPKNVDVKPVISQVIPIATSRVPISPLPSPEVIGATSAPQQTVQVPTPIPTETDTALSGTNNENMTTTPAGSAALPDEGHQSGLPSLEDLGQPQSANEVEVGTGLGVMDNMLDEITEIPFPSTSHQLPFKERLPIPQQETCTNKRKTRRVLKKKIHIVVESSDKFCRCTCGSKFKSKGAQKYHINFFNAHWKFKCERCPKKFYDLTKLKYHLKKVHGVENPLKGYKIGCTLCGIMFKLRSEFSKHKKTNHNIHKVPETVTRRQMTSRQSGLSPGTPMPLLSPQNLDTEWGTQGQHEVIDLASSDDEGDREMDESQGDTTLRQLEQQQPLPIGLMIGNQRESGNFSGETSPGLNMQNGHSDYGECYGCIMCTQVFRDLPQLRRHLQEGHQSAQMEVKCGICGMVLGSSKSFHEHRAQNHFVSGDKQGKERPSLQSSGQQADDFPSPPQMDEEGNHETVRNDDLRGKTNMKEEFVTVCRFYCRKDKSNVLFCVTCDCPPFSDDVKQLREHVSLKHAGKREIRCAKCKAEFGSCESFDQHRNQCSKSY